MSQIGKTVIIYGVLVIILGLLVSYGSMIPFISKLGHLPGDFVIKKGGFSLYVPVTTCLIISLIIHLILNIVRR